jgi:predicted GNAT family N-acyltransferase
MVGHPTLGAPVTTYTIEFVSVEWERFAEVLELSFAVLYEPFGLARPVDPSEKGADWMHPDRETHIAVAIAADGDLLGSARLLPEAGASERQVRQVAVFDRARGLGVGRALMLGLEAKAAEEGAADVWLNSRNTAYGFYTRLGYEAEGEEFISEVTGIPHRRMRKRLG